MTLAVSPKWAPAHLEGAEALRFDGKQVLAQTFRLVHQDGAVRTHALAVAPSEQAADGLAGCLAQQVPQRDVDAADRVGE